MSDIIYIDGKPHKVVVAVDKDGNAISGVISTVIEQSIGDSVENVSFREVATSSITAMNAKYIQIVNVSTGGQSMTVGGVVFDTSIPQVEHRASLNNTIAQIPFSVAAGGKLLIMEVV